MPGKHNAGGCGCCGCEITCNKSLYFSCTGVVDALGFPCLNNNGTISSIVPVGTAAGKEFFNDNDFFWNPSWTNTSTPGIEDLGIVDRAQFTQCSAATFALDYIANGPILISVLAAASVTTNGSNLRLILRFAANTSVGIDNGEIIETWEYATTCPTGTPSLVSRTFQNRYCCDFTSATVSWTWV